MVERELTVRDYRFTPYLSGELFYDSRYEVWNRNRYAIGVRTPLVKHLSIDTYLMRQNDSRSHPNHADILGLTLSFNY